jgi:uncharacterized protein
MKIFKIVFLILVFLILFLYFQNNYIVTEHIQISSPKLPEAFDKFTIVHLSDLHGKEFGKDNKILVTKIRNSKPDLIVITGDLIDHRFYNEKAIGNFLNKITEIAPVYYVTGNQEIKSPFLSQLEKIMKEKNIKILKNSSENISRNGQFIKISGVNDPLDPDIDSYFTNQLILKRALNMSLSTTSQSLFTILLTHRPEQFPLYIDYNIDLIFSGHAHGGQIRLPFVGGIFSPSQGYFPKYTNSQYTRNNSIMIVSRGLGNGSFPQRLFNQPEIIIATLRKK